MARSNFEWEPTEAELYAERYWKEHGYSYRLHKRYQSKSVYQVYKDGVECSYEVQHSIIHPEKDMEFFEKLFEMKRGLGI